MDVSSGNNGQLHEAAADYPNNPAAAATSLAPGPTIVTGKAVNGGSGGKEAVRMMIWMATMVVFLGHMMIWIMFPTTTYKDHWRTAAMSKTTSTYFGTSQAANVLLYTLPILFMAVAGAIYIHLGKSSIPARELGTKKNNHLALWKRPVLTKGPLGIVSGIEFSIFMMFIALLVWCLGVFLNKDYSTPFSSKKLAASYGGHLWRMKLDRTGLRLGLVGNIALSFLFFPVTRTSSILPLFGLTSEGSIKYHIWLGHIVMTIFTVHGFCYILLWVVNNEVCEMLKWAKTDISNVAGELSLLAGLVLWVTTYPRIRRKMFELFFYTHYLYILFVFFYVLHVGMSFAFMMLPGFFLFMIDRFLRFLQSRQCVRTVSARVLPSQAFELNFSKSQSLKYSPTSIVFINVPGISKLQWHPFTISSSSSLEPERLSVIIKVEGSWTRKLHQMLASSSLDRLEVALEGPYGPASTNFLRHDTLVMVSGGSGITPFFSIIRELIHTRTILNQNIPKLLLISAFKTSADLEMLDLLLPITGTPSDLSNIQLQIEAYVTREKVEDQSTKQINIRNIWFKPNVTDSPFTPILGKNGWIWLALIISFTFIGFLLLMGVMIQYYIYPIDHNTGEVFSMATESVLQMLILCGCVVVTCTIVVVWNKKRNAMEAKCVVSLEGATPTATPGSWFYNAERELESLPVQKLAESTKVYYGERPDIKRILFDCKLGSSVGVLVCGPGKMRREVAAVCASGLADHLHFEAISFSW